MPSSAPRDPQRLLRNRSALAQMVVCTALGAATSLASSAQVAEPANVVQPVGGGAAATRIALQASLAKQPGDAHAWYELGLLEGQLHNFAAAEQDLRRSLALDPASAQTHYLLGLSLVANPRAKLDWPGAIAEFRSALALRPAYPDALMYMGVGLTATGRHEDAVRALQQAIQLAPASASAQFNLALALEPLGRTSDAAAAYRQAIALRPGFAEAHSALAKLLFRGGDLPSAASEVRQALQTNPDLQDAHYTLGRILRAQHHDADARAEFEIALALGQREQDGIASSQRSNTAMRQAAEGDLAAAASGLREAIALRPDYGVPHYNLGLILADSGQWDASVSQLAQAVSLLPAQANPWFDLGRVLRRQGRTAESIACLRWAVALSPTPKILAELREAAGNSPVSTQAATQPSIGVHGEDARAFSAYAADLLTAGELRGAIGMWLHALAVEPAAVGPRLSLAAALRTAGDPTRAAMEYRKVLAVDAQNSVARAALKPLPAAPPPSAVH